MFDARYVNRVVGYPVSQDIGRDGNELAKTIIAKTSAFWEVDQTVAGIHQSLNEMVSGFRIELTKISADRLERDDRVLKPDYSNHSAGGGPS